MKNIRVMSKGEIQETEITGYFVVNYFDLEQHSLNDIQKFAIAKNTTIENAHNKNKILEVEVNDVEITKENIKKEKDKKNFPIKLFNYTDAKRIIDFVSDNNKNNFIFQCDFGRSRSLSTAIFCHRYILNDHRMSIGQQFIYNKSVYRILMKTLLFPLKYS